MEKDRNFRPRRRRAFDDHDYEPPRDFGAPPRFSSSRPRFDEPPSGPPVQAVVKWFKSEKGFGFVVAEDGGKDVFLHISIVDRAGIQVLPEGQPVRMRVVKTQKGREAISVALID